MKTKVGLWIDHRKALIVAISEKGEILKLIISALEKHTRRSPSSRHTGRYEPQRVAADDSRQRAFTGHLNIYYDAVIAGIGDAESILIFGPGEAKGELEKRLKKINMGGRIIGVETVDKMTERQIVVKVEKCFAEKP
jgi:hypothetical protein